MGAFLSTLGGWLESAITLILPMAGKARTSKSRDATLYWVVHAILVVGLLVGLYFLNVSYLKLGRFIPVHLRFLADAWLSILFLLLYLLAWLSWWLWKLLAPEQQMSDFPDIDAAWEEAVAALNKEGIALADAPLFVVLGRPEAPLAALFKAAQLKLPVNQVPRDVGAPLHVFANRDAIYVACPGVSILAKHAAVLAGDTEAMPSSSGGGGDNPEDELMGTLRPSSAPGGARQIGAVLAQAMKKGRSPEQLTEAERRAIRREERKGKPKPSLLKHAAEVDVLSARLEHLCRLIVRDRWPFCPANGILMLVPYGGTDSDQDAINTGEICQRELTVVRHALKVHCPLFALVCDMETALGFSEFIERFSEAERQQRMGQRCPLVPATPHSRMTAYTAGPVSEPPSKAMLDSLAQWICTMLVPGWIYKKFRLEATGRSTLADAVRTNARLCLFLDDLRERQQRLGTVLTQGLMTEGDPWLFGGCYVAGTGQDPLREQAFVPGVFRRLIDEQSCVRWTQEALDEEAVYQSWVRRGYVALSVLGILGLGMGGYYLIGPGTKPPPR